MLGIQNSLPVSNTVRFKGENNDYNDYENESYQVPALASREDIELERDKKLAVLRDTQADMDEFASALEQNSDKVSKKTGKAIRTISAGVGLVSAFVTAKYGSKFMINAFRNFAKSGTAQQIVKAGESVVKPLKKGAGAIGNTFDKLMKNPNVAKLKDSKLGQMAKNIANKPFVKNTIEKGKAYVEAGKAVVKSVNADKVQSAIENTMAASTTASVLIDNLAGRNNDRSNLDLALGTSGGDK